MKTITLTLLTALALSCSSGKAVENPNPKSGEASRVEPKKGDLATRGGTATVRKPLEPKTDDPKTSNNESNDQPVGHFGTKALTMHNVSSGNTYDLDADIEGGQLRRVYFPKGGWVDFDSCELGATSEATCTDENGNKWEIVEF